MFIINIISGVYSSFLLREFSVEEENIEITWHKNWGKEKVERGLGEGRLYIT